MKALLLEGSEDVKLREIPRPICSPEGALLKVKACGVCGGDVRTYFHGFGSIRTDNKIMGHEIAGEVVEVGSRHTTYKVGARLALAAELHCMECYYCRNEMNYLCNDLRIIGKHVTGGFAEFFHLTKDVMEHGCINYIPDNLTYEEAAISEPLCSIISAQDKLSIRKGTNVLIIGGGPMGFLHAKIAYGKGANVILSGTNEKRMKKAQAILPIKHYVNPRFQDVRETVDVVTNGIGVDVVIVAVPNKAAVEEALNYVRKGGKIDIFGGVPKSDSILNLDSNKLHYDCIQIIGDFSYHPKVHKEALNLISTGKVDPHKFMTVVPMERFQTTVEEIKNGDHLKVVLSMED